MTDSGYICDRCKEPLGFVEIPGYENVPAQVMLRPCRFSKCKEYPKRRNGYGDICKALSDSRDGAVMEFEHLTAVRA